MKYSKFIATAATATLVASAIVPVASAAERNFTDIVGYDVEVQGAINALAEQGIINGTSETTFTPGKAITRGQVVKMLGKWVETQGFDVPTNYGTVQRFSDVAVDAQDQELVKYAAIAYDAGVFQGNNGVLNASGKITRENMALVLDRAYKAVIGTSLVELATDAEDVTVSDLATAKAEAQPAIQALKDLGITKPANFNPKGDVTRANFAAFLNRTINAEVPTSTPAVKSVKVVNGVTVEVQFNTAVNKNDIANKVTIQGTTLVNPTLSEDGKTLTLSSATAIDVKDAAVVVEPIQTASDALVKTAKYVSVVTYEDTVAPTISSVEATTNGKTATSLTVETSEPIKTGALAKVDGKYYVVDFANKNTATITGLTLEAGKTHTLELLNLEDIAGNKAVSASKTFNVTVDATAPTATLSVEGDSAILVTFDKSMDTVSVIAALANGVVKDELLGAVASSPATVVEDSNNKQFLIPLNDQTIFASKASRTFSVVLNNTIKDALGNKLVATTKSVTLTKDTTKPVATGYNVVRDASNKVKSIEVSFSEGLKAAAADAVDFGNVVTSNGVLDTTTFAELASEEVKAGDKKVTFTFATAKEITGKYAVSFENALVTDLAIAANKSAAFSYTIDLGQATTVNEFEITTDVTSLNNVITVTFPEAVKGGAVVNSATDANNYTLAGKPLPENTKITLAADQKVATIVLPEGGVVADDEAAVFTVANVKNLEGTKTVKTYTQTIAVKDSKAPELQSAVVVDNKTIELTYDENLLVGDGNVDDEFTIVVGDAELTVAAGALKAAAVSGFDKKIRITLTTATFDVNETITVESKASATAAVTDASDLTNDQKAEIKVTVASKN